MLDVVVQLRTGYLEQGLMVSKFQFDRRFGPSSRDWDVDGLKGRLKAIGEDWAWQKAVHAKFSAQSLPVASGSASGSRYLIRN